MQQTGARHHRDSGLDRDTGMGLERLTAVLQHVHSNYEIDLFVTLLAAPSASSTRPARGDCDQDSPSLKVIADHIRACAFTVVDGVIPGNEGRGYVLRRITRRAIRHGYKLGARKPFFHKLVADLAAEMGDAYPELRRDGPRATDVLRQEEERFFQTIANGMEILEAAIAALPAHGERVLGGDVAFKLHDTYGFPLDLTADVCRERGVAVDTAGFDVAMARQREQARAAGKFKMAQGLEYTGAATTFHGYETLDARQRPGRRDLRRRQRRGVGARPATTPSSCSTTRRSTPSPAARSATPASCATPRRACWSKTRSRSRRRCSATKAASSKARSRSATWSTPRSTSSAAPAPCATTAPPT